MKRFLSLTMLVVLAVEAAHAQGLPPLPPLPPYPPLPIPGQTAPVESATEVEEPDVPDEIVQIVRGDRRMTTKIAFVVDTSGSMDNSRRVQMGITFVRDRLAVPQDELLVQMYAFKTEFERWPGVPPDPNEQRFGPPPPEGWTEFPSAIALERAQQWLSEQGASGGTNPVGALTAALSLEQRDLSVVLITDGDFNNTVTLQFIASVEALQQQRIKKNLGRAVIFVIGTGESSENETHLTSVGRANGGGFHVIRPGRSEKAVVEKDQK